MYIAMVLDGSRNDDEDFVDKPAFIVIVVFSGVAMAIAFTVVLIITIYIKRKNHPGID